jgi:hypothetical protein
MMIPVPLRSHYDRGKIAKEKESGIQLRISLRPLRFCASYNSIIVRVLRLPCRPLGSPENVKPH